MQIGLFVNFYIIKKFKDVSRLKEKKSLYWHIDLYRSPQLQIYTFTILMLLSDLQRGQIVARFRKRKKNHKGN